MSELRLSPELQSDLLALAEDLQLNPEACLRMLINQHALLQGKFQVDQSWVQACKESFSKHHDLLEQFQPA